ncbi:TonB-dependent receptor domain-containing protein [Terriglobus sp.]|uniref:TonB-dependent receptor n=1 Tax=Terriglobus sp. TaxID=1889013 RepID=UPI003B0051BA
MGSPERKTLPPADLIRGWLFAIFLLVSACGGSAIAQVDQGTITGTVKDPSGAVVPNAQVTVTNVDTAFTLTDKTDSNGIYTFSPLKIGKYTVKVVAPGFTTKEQENVQLHVGERAGVDVDLSVGNTDTVQVTTEAPLLQTGDGSTGQVIEAQTIVDTPLNGRNYVFIAQLTTGIAPANGSRGGGAGDFNANGQRAEQNNFLLDGVDNNVNVVDFFNGASYSVRPPPEALAEFKVQTGAYSAEFGHSAGAVINTSVKSGTNSLHGSAWEYIRNDAFDIHEWSSFGNRTVPKYRQNQFGGTVGFPVFRNKLFLFGDAEANRIIFAETGTYTVPTALMRQGNFSELLNPALTGTTRVQLVQPNSGNIAQPIANNTLLPNQINQTALKILNLYPLPNQVINGRTAVSNYFSNRNAVNNTTQFDVRADYNATQHDQAFVRASYSDTPGSRSAPLGPVLDGGGFGDTGTIINFSEALAASETHVFNPNLVNEARFGYNYGHFGFLQPNGTNTGLPASIGLGGIPGGQQNGGLPNVSVSGISSFGSPTFAVTDEYQNVYQILDNVTKIAGNHSLRMGVNFQRIRFSTTQPTQPRGSYGFTGKFTSAQGSPTVGGTSYAGYGVADFLTNNMDTAAISNVFTSDDVRWIRAAYVQDDWKATPNLTLNLGLRYEYAQPYLERHDNQAAFIVNTLAPGAGTGFYRIPQSKSGVPLAASFTNTLAANRIAIQYSGNRFLVESQKANFAPRFGLAYKMSDKLVARSGYGIFYGGLESAGYYPNLGENYPFEFDSTYNSQTLYGSCNVGNCRNNGITLENGFSAAIAAGLQNSVSNPNLRGSDPKIKTPYSQQYNLSFEYAVDANLSATVSYVGANSRHLVVFPDRNSSLVLAAPGVNTNPYQPFPTIGGNAYSSYAGSSNYNSLQAKLDQRLRNGLSFLASYTYSHALDDAVTPLNSTGDSGYRNPNLIGISSDYSNSPFDVRHRFTINGSYAIPYGVGRAHGNHHGILDLVLGGWTNSLTFIAQTGNPFSIGPNITTSAGSSAHPNKIRDPFASGGTPDPDGPQFTCPTGTRNTVTWFNPCSFRNPPRLTGNQTVTGLDALRYLGSPRNTVYGPGYERINGSLYKNFGIWREATFQLRADYFNLLNTPAYANPGGAANTNSQTALTLGGAQITSSRSLGQFYPDSRFFQFAAKINF